jgi:hypothetical protein
MSLWIASPFQSPTVPTNIKRHDLLSLAGLINARRMRWHLTQSHVIAYSGGMNGSPSSHRLRRAHRAVGHPSAGGKILQKRKSDCVRRPDRGRNESYSADAVEALMRVMGYPYAIEQAGIERMKSMRANGATYREIGGAVGLHGRTVQRILDRT